MKPGSALFVINPVSGGTDKEILRQEIDRFLEQNSIEGHYFETTGRNDELKLQKSIAAFRPEIVVAVGGDGTVHLVAAAISGQSIPVAIVPAGSGNGLSKDLGIPQQTAEALHVLLRNKVRKIDTLLVNGKTCVHLADLGFNALVVKRFDEAETRGTGTYAKVALQEYLNFEPGRYIIQSDNERFEGEAFMITITNARNFGSNVTVNPNAVLNDGVFEICILEPFPKAVAVGILLKMYNQTIDKSEYSRIIKCREASIFNNKKEFLQIDGEVQPAVKTVKIKIQEKHLPILLPADAAKKL